MARAFLVVLLFASALAARGVRADDAPGSATADALAPEIAAAIETLRKAKDDAGLERVIVKVPMLVNPAKDPAAKNTLADALAKVAKDKRLTSARLVAVEALGSLQDKKLAWKHLKALVPDGKAEKASDVDVAVLRATGQVGDLGAVDGLVALVEKAKAATLAKEAADALSGYGYGDAEPKAKVRILDALLTVVARIRPAPGPDGAVNPEAAARYAEISGAVVSSANSLSGRSLGLEEWLALHKESKADLTKLLAP